MEIYSTPIYGEALQLDTIKAKKNKLIFSHKRKENCMIPRIFHYMRTPDRTPGLQSRESLPLLFHHMCTISLESYS